MIGTGARRLVCDRTPYALEIGDGRRVPARSVIIATGAEYRRLPVDNLSRFDGAGGYYPAAFMEAQLCAGGEGIGVGGGHSAGPAGGVFGEAPPPGRKGGPPRGPARHLVGDPLP